MTPTRLLPALALAVLLPCAPAHAQQATGRLLQRVDVDWTFVGDPGNPADFAGKGKVDKEYRIGTYEVTNEQYSVMLNWKARFGDPLGLFNPLMQSDPRGGIARFGNGTLDHPWIYVPRLDMAHKPVNFVSCFDAMRFANWMNNGQGNANTEDGAYTLLGGTPTPSNGDSVNRNPGSAIYLPSENQWYKAAFYDGGAGVYHLYATGSSVLPTVAAATVVGEVANPGPDTVNYNSGADWNGQDGNVVTVGTAGNRTPYGAADMNGNVFEWTQTIFVWQASPYRVSRGGGWFFDETVLPKTSFGAVKPWVEGETIGFRLAAAAQ